MKIPKSAFSEYFKRSVIYLVKTQLAVFVISIIEFIDLLTNMIDISIQIFHLNSEYFYKNNKLSEIMLAVSPYQYYFNFMTGGSDSGFTRNYLGFIVYFLLFVWYFAFFCTIRNCDLETLNGFTVLFQKISINFFDYFPFACE